MQLAGGEMGTDKEMECGEWENGKVAKIMEISQPRRERDSWGQKVILKLTH